jgi:hypothetical protein
MKILPPADENERQALKLRLEEALGAEQGGYWRVDIIAGRYGWYVRSGTSGLAWPAIGFKARNVAMHPRLETSCLFGALLHSRGPLTNRIPNLS